MGVELFWDDEAETVFLIEVRGQWRWEELTRVMKTVQRLSQERGQTMGAILDLGTGLQMPEGGIFSQQGLQQFQDLLKLDTGGARGPLVIVGMNPLVKRIFDTANSLAPSASRQITFADTLSEARQRVYRAMSSQVSPQKA
jgi:hypothetical protein